MEGNVSKSEGDSDSFESQVHRPEIRTAMVTLARRENLPPDDCEDIAAEVIEQAAYANGAGG